MRNYDVNQPRRAAFAMRRSAPRRRGCHGRNRSLGVANHPRTSRVIKYGLISSTCIVAGVFGKFIWQDVGVQPCCKTDLQLYCIVGMR